MRVGVQGPGLYTRGEASALGRMSELVPEPVGRLAAREPRRYTPDNRPAAAGAPVMTLQIAPELRDRIRECLLAAYPEEGCGFLLGRDGDEREVRQVLAARNTSFERRSHHFTIAPEEFLAADRQARQVGLDVLGFFHSHPDSVARPSSTDVEDAWPWYSYLIVSVARGGAGEMTCWRKASEGAALLPEALL